MSSQETRFASLKYLLLFIGLVLLFCAQILFETQKPVIGEIEKAAIWNVVNKLEIVNYDNAWLALPFFFGGFSIWLWLANIQKEESLFSGIFALEKNINWGKIKYQLIVIVGLYEFLLIRLLNHYNTFIEPILWILTILWLTHLIWNWDRANNNLSMNFGASSLTDVLILLIIGIAIGAFALTDLPRQILPDEAEFWSMSRAIALGENHASFFDVGVYTFPLATSAYQSWIMKFFGVTIWSWKFSSVLAGVFTVIPLYLLAREWFDRRTALVVGLLMLINPYFLSFSRFGYNNSQALFPVTLAVYFWGKGMRKNSIFYLWLGGLTAGLGYYSFFAAWIGPVAIGLSIVFMRFQKQIPVKQFWGILAILLIAFFVMAAPRVAFAIGSGKTNTLILKIIQVNFTNYFYAHYYYADSELTAVHPLISAGKDQQLFFNPQIYWELFVRGGVRTFLAIFDPYIAIEHFLVSSFAGVFIPVFFSIGLASALKNRKHYHNSLLLIWLFGGLFFLSVIDTFPPRQTHLVSVIPIIALLSGVGIVSTVDQLIRKESLARKAIFLIIGLSLVLNLYAYFITLPVEYPANLQEYAVWIARRNSQQITLIYAESDESTYNLNWMIKEGIIENPFLTLPADRAVEEAVKIKDMPAVLVYEGNSKAVAEVIKRLGFSGIYISSHSKGELDGYIFTNAGIDLEPGASPLAELRSFLESPAVPLLSFLIIVLIASIALSKKSE